MMAEADITALRAENDALHDAIDLACEALRTMTRIGPDTWELHPHMYMQLYCALNVNAPPRPGKTGHRIIEYNQQKGANDVSHR